MRLSHLLVLSLSLSALTVYAETEEQHGKHEHGVASLSIALDSKGLEISLDSPAANVVGFEHKPSTDEQSQQVAKVKAQLETPASLFEIPAAAECSLTNTELQAELIQVSSDNETTQHEHKHEAENHAHSDIEATWQFTCIKPAELSTLSTKLFATFPAIKQLKVEWLNGDKASALTLEQDAAVLLK